MTTRPPLQRGQVWLAEVGRKRRPVVVLTRSEVLDVRHLVTVAEVTTSIRGISAEVAFDHDAVGLSQESVVNCDGIHTVSQSMLAKHVGALDATTMSQVCAAVGYALGCSQP